MPLKRFLSTAAPLAILAFAGMGLATAQSSSPFAKKSRAQAWEQQPAVQSAPTSWQAPADEAYAPTTASYAPSSAAPYAPKTASYAPPAPYKAPAISQIPTSSEAPIATRPRRSTALPSYSAATPPKTFGGQPAAAAQYAAAAPQYQGYAPLRSTAPASAASSAPSAAQLRGSDYSYTPPPVRAVAQAPDFGSPVPPTTTAQKPTSPYAAPASSGGSPYAPQSGTRTQAWETQPGTSYPAPAYQTPSYQQPASQAPQYQQPQYQGQTQGQSYGGSATPPTGYVPQNGYQPAYQSSTPPTGAPYPGGPYSPGPQQPRSWKDKLGLGNIATLLRGAFTLGAAATNRDAPENQFGPEDGWSEDFIGDAELDFEISAITQGGLEYGIALGARGQYDPYRRGFGGRLPDCPAGIDGCSGDTTGLRGHTSGFYSAGEDIAKDAQFALESAHIFLRSAYGDVTAGRDDGAAYLFSLGAPTLLAIGASNSPVDYTGYDSVKTVNDASGFGEKITYTTPRLLGDQIGLGVQLGLSYAPDADVCGVDYCNGKNITDVIQPEIEDVLEAGLALDRTFSNGVRAELTGTYARGNEASGLDGLDDLESFGAGLEFEYGDWTLGGSFLQSNNGLLDGDYTAYDAGLTWKPGALGFTLGYGYAEDDNVGLSSNQGTFGVTYDFNKFTLGTGVQYVDREVNGVALGLPTTLDQKATSVFVQGGFKF